MKGGKIIIQGNAGNNIGGGMMAGEIYIGGDAGNFCGIRMNGGEITVRGDAGRAPEQRWYQVSSKFMDGSPLSSRDSRRSQHSKKMDPL